MRSRIVERRAFTVAGTAVNTSQANQAADAAQLAVRFFTPGFADSLEGRVDPSTTYAVYADYDEADETFRMILGFEVDPAAAQPAGIDVLAVPAGRYTVFTAVGPQVGVLFRPPGSPPCRIRHGGFSFPCNNKHICHHMP